jgi:hypothetical protein
VTWPELGPSPPRVIRRFRCEHFFVRLTLAFSKKRANLKASVALHFAHYNFRARPSDAALYARLWPLA